MQLFRDKYQKKGDVYEDEFRKIRSYTVLILLMMRALLTVPVLVLFFGLTPINLLWMPLMIVVIRKVGKEMFITELVLHVKRYMYDKEFYEQYKKENGLIETEE